MSAGDNGHSACPPSAMVELEQRLASVSMQSDPSNLRPQVAVASADAAVVAVDAAGTLLPWMPKHQHHRTLFLRRRSWLTRSQAREPHPPSLSAVLRIAYTWTAI